MSSAQKKQADTTACISALQVRREEIQLAVKARLWLCAGAIARKSATKALLPRPDAVAKPASLVLIAMRVTFSLPYMASVASSFPRALRVISPEQKNEW
jgi:hypothetical protein